MTRAATQTEIADHDRDHRKHDRRLGVMDLAADQQYALAKLIGAMEGVISSGVLDDSGVELELRGIVATALSAFQMPSKSERKSADA
jgi:hypothetical protein